MFGEIDMNRKKKSPALHILRRFSSGLPVRESVRALSRNKLRSALPVIGIGIAAVVCVMAIGAAGSRRAEQQFRNLGDNFIWIEAGSRNINGVRSGSHGMNTLTMVDVEAIRQGVPGIRRVSPNVDGNVPVSFGDLNWTTHYLISIASISLLVGGIGIMNVFAQGNYDAIASDDKRFLKKLDSANIPL